MNRVVRSERVGGGQRDDQPSEWDQITIFETLDVHRRSLESDDIQYKSRDQKKAIWSADGRPCIPRWLAQARGPYGFSDPRARDSVEDKCSSP